MMAENEFATKIQRLYRSYRIRKLKVESEAVFKSVQVSIAQSLTINFPINNFRGDAIYK
jgi:hypothetical protein